ncbi:MAG: hypothetical protein WAJ93_10355 [Candidatus Nitrosopolaris sp.]
MIITATNNKALTMIGVFVVFSLIMGASFITQLASASKSNGGKIACVHPSPGTNRSHNNDMTTKQNDDDYDYGTQSYFGQQIFRNVPYGSPFPFRNVPFGLPFSNDYGTQPYFAQHKFREPFELPFP